MKLAASVFLLGSVAATPMIGGQGQEEAHWVGDFEGDKFEKMLSQSSSPFAAELLSLRDDQAELTIEEMETIEIEQRGWFDDPVTREERRKKKVETNFKDGLLLTGGRLKCSIGKVFVLWLLLLPRWQYKVIQRLRRADRRGGSSL